MSDKQLLVRERREPEHNCSTGDQVRGWCDHVPSNIIRPVTTADLVAALIAEGGEIRYRPNGDKLLVFKMADGRPPEPTLPEPEEPVDG